MFALVFIAYLCYARSSDRNNLKMAQRQFAILKSRGNLKMAQPSRNRAAPSSDNWRAVAWCQSAQVYLKMEQDNLKMEQDNFKMEQRNFRILSLVMF